MLFISVETLSILRKSDVDATIESNVIAPLAQTFINNSFELVPVLKQLFKSEHFFLMIVLWGYHQKSFDLIFQYINETEFLYNDLLMEAFLYYAGTLGQIIFDPQTFPDGNAIRIDQYFHPYRPLGTF